MSTALILSGCGSFLETAPHASDEHGFVVYFIDVGQADSALVVCDGVTMLIDGGNVADSDLVYTFLKNHSVSRLDYIVATHAHEDHVGGLAGALNYAQADVALCPVTEYKSKAFENFTKYLGNQGVPITAPKLGDSFKLEISDYYIFSAERSIPYYLAFSGLSIGRVREVRQCIKDQINRKLTSSITAM